MQGLNYHKHLMPYMGLHDARPLLKVRLPVRMLLSGSYITSDAMKPKFPLTSGAEELPSPAAGELEGLVSSGGSSPIFPVLSRAALAAAAVLGSVFSFDIAVNEDTRVVWSLYRVWLGEGVVNGQLLMGI